MKQNEKIIISVNVESVSILEDYIKENPDNEDIVEISRISLVGGVELVDFIISLTPALISSLTVFLVAKMKYAQERKIIIKSGDNSVEITNEDLDCQKVEKILRAMQRNDRAKK